MDAEKKFYSEFNRLMAEAKRTSEFEFVNVLLGYKGMGEILSLTHFYESESLFHDLSALVTADHTNKNNIRIGMFLYSHFFEMDELYRIVGNLLNIVNGERFHPFLYDDINEDDLTPKEKIGLMRKVAEKCGFAGLMDCFDELYSNKLRNSFYHSNYSISDNAYINTSRRHTIKLNGNEYNSLNLETQLFPLISTCIRIANFFFDEIKKEKSEYKVNKIILGQLSSIEPIMILGDPIKGLVGWESSSGSAMRISEIGGAPFLGAYNLRITNPNIKNQKLNQRLTELVDKNAYVKDDSVLAKLEVDIQAANEPVLLKQLAIPYYNWGNNIREIAEAKENQFERRSLKKIALSKYEKSLEYDPEFAPCLLNKVLVEVEINNLENRQTNYEKIYDAVVQIQKLGEASAEIYFNAGYFGLLAVQDVDDSILSEKILPEATSYLLKCIQLNPADCKANYTLGHSYWLLSKIKSDLEKIEMAELANKYLEIAYQCEPGNLTYIFELSAFLEYYATLTDKDPVPRFKRAIEVLENADKLFPGNEVILYKRGIKKFNAGMYSVDNNESEKYLQSAIMDYQQATKITSKAQPLLNNLGVAYLKLGELYNDDRSIKLYEQTIDIMDKILQSDPENLNANRNKAESYLELFRIVPKQEYLDIAHGTLNHLSILAPDSNKDLIDQFTKLSPRNNLD